MITTKKFMLNMPEELHARLIRLQVAEGFSTLSKCIRAKLEDACYRAEKKGVARQLEAERLQAEWKAQFGGKTFTDADGRKLAEGRLVDDQTAPAKTESEVVREYAEAIARESDALIAYQLNPCERTKAALFKAKTRLKIAQDAFTALNY